MSQSQVEILPDKAALVQRALQLTLDTIQAAIDDHGYCTMALAGGSTPKPLYEALAKQDLPWSKLYIFWADERYVPINHPDSNAGMAKLAWLDQVPIPADQVHTAPTTPADPAAAAAAYAQTIQSVFHDLTGDEPNFPAFDLVQLGMGDDGHTASLFPHTAALAVEDQLVTVGDKAGDPRLTFTVPLINHSRTVMFLVAGANKQHALGQVFAAEADSLAFPSRLIQPQGTLWWLLDAAAGLPLASLG